jgi:hypothetical protein
MTQNLAEQLTAKLNASGVQATVCDLFADLDTVIYDTLVDIGEEARRPAQPLGSITELTNAIERCFQDA